MCWMAEAVSGETILSQMINKTIYYVLGTGGLLRSWKNLCALVLHGKT